MPGADETARFAFIVPTLNIPIEIPVAVRTGDDYGLRFTVAGITQLAPLAGADLTFWGFPADASHDAQRFPKGSPGNPAGCPGLADTSCNRRRTAAEHPGPTRSPTTRPSAPGSRSVTTLEVETYQDPATSPTPSRSYPATPAARKRPSNRSCTRARRPTRPTPPSGLDIELSAAQFARVRRLALGDQIGDRHPARRA